MVAEWVSTTRRWPSFTWFARCWPRLTERARRATEPRDCSDAIQRAATVRYYLGRGRRAREGGHFEAACSNARHAIDANPGNPWAHALLGQCLMRLRCRDLVEARRSLERACALDPANGYFVRLLLDVLDALGDATARDDALAWAWWNGAPVERWLPDGPARRKVTGEPAVSNPPRSESLHPGMMQPVTDRTREPVGAAGGVPG